MVNISPCGTGSGSVFCEVDEDFSDSPDAVVVGPPYGPDSAGPTPAANLKLLLAMIDNQQWPLHVCGDTGTGVNAPAWGFADTRYYDYEAIDSGPFPVPGIPVTNQTVFPGIGISAYGCQLGCSYQIVGDLGAEVIVGKIDNQWHILRVTGSAETAPMFGSDNSCRCCGKMARQSQMRAKILSVTPDGCGLYPECTEFTMDPVAEACGGNLANPLGIEIYCNSSPGSLLEDPTDWTASVCGQTATIESVQCCTTVLPSCDVGSGSGSNSGSGSGLSTCQTAIVIETAAMAGCDSDGCTMRILITWETSDPCVEFDDVPIDEVVAEACGLASLHPGDRVILAKIPGGAPGRTALGGEEPVEWFVIRACSNGDCEDQCGSGAPFGPPCCGGLCSEMPETLTATLEMLSGSCPCADPIVVTLTKLGGSSCDAAADVRWIATNVVPAGTLCIGETNEPPGGPYPISIVIDEINVFCDTVTDDCAVPGSGSGSGSGSWSGYTDGPNMPMGMSIPGSELTMAVQNLKVSCCSPMYMEYEVTIDACRPEGAGDVPYATTFRVTITE